MTCPNLSHLLDSRLQTDELNHAVCEKTPGNIFMEQTNPTSALQCKE